MPIYRVRGRTLSILGFGKIGQTLATRAGGFGLRILAHDPNLSEEVIRENHAEPVGLDELITQADYLSLHTPLTADTHGLLNADRLRRMKPTAFVINTARGALIDLHALQRALQEGWIAGAALDVFEPERLPADHPLLALPNLIATPHVAFYSEESVLDLQIKAARNVADILAGRRPESVVNPEVLDLPRWAHLY
jgi:D-3-phosphoglycerate dehydrogenase